MGRQRNRPQMKTTGETSEKELHEMEASTFLDIEFKIIVLRLLNSVEKDIETTKTDKLEMKLILHFKVPSLMI